MRHFLILSLMACGGTASMLSDNAYEVVVLPAVPCSCDLEGTTSFLTGQDGGPTLVICAPACTPVGKTPLGPNVPVCEGIPECLNCCHWLTPRELGL